MSQGRAAFYLQIPADYCRSFGGLRWAQYGEAVEFLEGPAAGRTFAFAAEIDVFLEGLAGSGGALPGFGFVLHLLYLIGLGDRATRHGEGGAPCVERLAAPFRALGCPLRNAGALCSWLSREAPSTPDPPDLIELHEIMTGGSWVPQMVLSHPSLGVMDQAEAPGLESEEFQELIRRATDRLSDGEIKHWLRHGCAPERGTRDGQPMHPRSLAETLAELERRPRLAGVGRLISRLDGVLTLPPRRLAWSELQHGGYADITTRGMPEQILPIQFALEGEEFLRRFAEHELLYFHREEPRQPTTEEIVLLLDQGVRTWGNVRLVLTGAVIALARQAQRRRIAIKLAATSNDGEAVDPAFLDPAALSELLEASDLSAHPAHALERLLDGLAPARRDIVLLTHPRSLSDPAVAAVARTIHAGQGARLFAITVDAHGTLEVAELRRGLPVVLARSRISPVENDSTAKPARSRGGGAGRAPWTGSFESIGFPFRTGALDTLDVNNWSSMNTSFDFDEEGERIMFAGRHGLLFTCRVDGRECETLPRTRLGSDVMKGHRTVVGVAGGFVVEGQYGNRRALAHYDFSTRTATVHEVDDTESNFAWMYYRDLHTIVGLPFDRGASGVAFDLGAPVARAASSSRATRAAARAEAGILPESWLIARISKSPNGRSIESTRRAPRLDAATGTLRYHHEPGQERSVTPLVDGRPALEGGRIHNAIQGGDVIAINVTGADASGLYFLSMARGSIIGMVPLFERRGLSKFALSRDGRRFAGECTMRQLEVRDVPGDQPPLLVTTYESVWSHFVTLGRSCLLVREFDSSGPRNARSSCLIRWDQGRLEVTFHAAGMLLEELGGTVAVSRSIPPGYRGADHDPDRFVQIVEDHGPRILIDRYNHVVVMGRDGEPVCLFFISGNEVAAWLPDGTTWGSRRLIDGEPGPGASERIASALASVTATRGRS